MLLNFALLIIGATGRQAISTPFDMDFGKVDYNYRTASVLWAYYLIDPWKQDGGEIRYTGKGLAEASRPCFQDLLTRLDRPIFEDVALGNMNPHPADEKDDLAAGIAFWTLQWKADAMHKEGWEKMHTLAEHFLLKASREGDVVQQSFASLAYAYCDLREYGDHVGFVGTTPVPPLPDREARLDEHRTRLIDTYNRFRISVPERALRAAFQLLMLGGDERRAELARPWQGVIKREFGNLGSWYSYRFSN